MKETIAAAGLPARYTAVGQGGRESPCREIKRMELLKTLAHSLSALDRPKKMPTKAVARVEDSRPAATEPAVDRRMQPDRRRRQLPFKGPDRRRQSTRRRPALLHPRTRKATTLEDRRGRNVSTSA